MGEQQDPRIDDANAAESASTPWLTLFPWLEIAGRSGAVEQAEDLSRWTIDELVSLAVERMTGWLLGALFPGVPNEESLLDPPFSVRLSNVLRREGKFRFGDIADMPLRDVMAMRSMGAKSITELLRFLAATAIARPFEAPSDDAGETPRARRKPSRTRAGSADIPPEPVRAVMHDLDLLSTWGIARGEPAASLLASEPGPYAPDDIVAAYERVHAISASDFMGTREVPDLGTLLTELSLPFDPRETAILYRRLGAREPDTLDALAGDFGLTRERIRQLEAMLKPKLRAWIAPDTVVGLRTAALRERIAPFAYTPDVLRDIPSLGGMLGDSDIPAWFLLERIDDELETDGDWMATPTMMSAREETLLRFEQVARDSGAASDDEVREAIGTWARMQPERLGDWLIHLGFTRLPGGWCEPGRRSISQLAAAYLELLGRPERTAELHEAIASDRSVQSVRNALISDDRFQRTDRDAWGLAAWGGTPYAGIRQAIEDLLREHGGFVTLETVTEIIASRFSVSPKSVAIYANTAPLTVRDGIVSLAASRAGARRSVGMTRNVYVAHDGVRYRIHVNNDHLRGSASPMPLGLAEALDIPRGGSVTFTGGGTSLVGMWTADQPAFASFRDLLVTIDASKHDEVVVAWNGGAVDAWIVSAADASPMRKVAALLGLRPTEAFDRRTAAIALELAEDASWNEISDRLRARNESDLAELAARLAPAR